MGKVPSPAEIIDKNNKRMARVPQVGGVAVPLRYGTEIVVSAPCARQVPGTLNIVNVWVFEIVRDWGKVWSGEKPFNICKPVDNRPLRTIPSDRIAKIVRMGV